jgi:hypothetical protein
MPVTLRSPDREIARSPDALIAVMIGCALVVYEHSHFDSDQAVLGLLNYPEAGNRSMSFVIGAPARALQSRGTEQAPRI